MQQLSPLLARYNGFMLGHFLAMAAFRSLRPRYPLLRRRVNAFLGETGASHRIPTNVEDYQADALSQILSVLTALRSQSTDCASTAWLSSAVLFKAQGSKAFNRKRLLVAADALAIEPGLVLEYEKSVPRSSSVRVADLLGPGMVFLHRLLAGLRSERRTCFVAMPFHAPFERYYESFYRPALHELGFRAVRAWGGVGMENYLEVVLMLMAKSGACLADVTGQNPNVLYELGAAQGMGKKVFIVNEGTKGKLPANVTQYTAFRFHYDSAATGWPVSEALRFAAQNAFAEFALAQSSESAG